MRFRLNIIGVGMGVEDLRSIGKGRSRLVRNCLID